MSALRTSQPYFTRRSRRSALFVGILLLGLASLATAIPTVYMDPLGSDANDGSSPTDMGGGIGPKLTLPSAFAAVDAAGTINVAAGVYNHGTGFLNLDKSVSIIGAQDNVDPRPFFGSTRSVANANESLFNITTNDNFVRIAADNVVMRGLAINRTAVGTGGDTITSLGIASPDLYDDFYFGYNILQASDDTRGDDALNLVSFGNPIIEYNYINNARTTAIKIRGGSSDAGTNASDGMVFRFNELDNCWNQTGSTSAAAIDVIGESRNNQIIGNRITNTGPVYAILVGNTNDTGLNSGGLVLDNVIVGGSGGIAVSRVNTTVQGNDISAIDGLNNAINAAITIRSFGAAAESNVVIRDNIVSNCPMAATRGGGLLIGAGFTDHASVVIEGNDFTFITPYGVKNSSAANVNANNCYFGGGAPPGPAADGTLDAQTNISTLVTATPLSPAPVVQMDLTWSDASLDFGPIVSSSTQDLTIDLANAGNATVPVINAPGVIFSGPDAARFSLAPSSPAFPLSLGTPGFQTLVVRYDPAGDPGPHFATATVDFIDSVGPTYSASFALTGVTGPAAPDFAGMTITDEDGGASALPGFTNFGTVDVTANEPTGGPADTLHLSEDSTFTTETTYPYGGSGSISVSFDLSAGDGAKTVFGKFSGAGGDGADGSAMIELDTVTPTAASLDFTSEGFATFAYTEPMHPAGVTTAANYAISGPGAGTLATNPDFAVPSTATEYTLGWISGDMVFGGDVTVAASNVRDRAGNPIGAPASATDIAGGIPVEVSAFNLE